MKKNLLCALIFSIVGCLRAADVSLDATQSSLKFTGHSLLHDFDGEAKGFTGSAQMDPKNPEVVVAAKIEIPAAKMTTFEAARDSNMDAWLRVDANPTISFQLGSVKLIKGDPTTATKAHPAQFSVSGEFTLNQVTRKLETQAVGWRDRGLLVVTGTTRIDTTDYGLPIFKKFLMSVDKEVDVSFHLAFDIPAELQLSAGN